MSVTDSGVLEPRLTAFDKRVLAVLPPEFDEDNRPCEPMDLWLVGRELEERDLDGLEQVLMGMARFALASHIWPNGKPRRWWRTRKGSEAIR